MQLSVIAYARNGYSSKFGIPRQSGCAPSVLTRIVFEPEYRQAEALRGIEQWSHLWLIWEFSEAHGWSPTVRPPRLGGNRRMGVFATRSPFRPNPLGLSSVRLERVEHTETEGFVLWVSGADLMDGTPIYDIKPYLPYTDIHTDATSGFATDNSYRLKINIPDTIKAQTAPDALRDIVEILEEDPRPQYQDDPDRLYRFEYNGLHIAFRVDGNEAEITEITRAQ